MGARLVPVTILASISAFAVSAAVVAATAVRAGLWSAAVALVMLGGIVPMIQAVNIRIVPVFARRVWPSERRLAVQVGLSIAGAWLVFAGRVLDSTPLQVLGSVAALGGGLVFMTNMIRLFRQPLSSAPAPPVPFPEQVEADALGTRLTRLSGRYLVLGLAIGAVVSIWTPASGRWDLVWAHALLVGCFMTMAAGVCYHVLSRWTGRRWRYLPLMRVHVQLVVIGLPAMLVALALEWTSLFAVAGASQAIALLLFLAAIAPMLLGLSGPTRAAFLAAAGMLTVGIALALGFALDPAFAAQLRTVHAEINLFGWTGLLISGAGYYLFPRFAGQPLRWPRLAWIQLGLVAGGVTLAAIGGVWRASGGPEWAFALGMAIVTVGFLIFAAVIAGTFFGSRRGKGVSCEVSVVKARSRAPAGGGLLPAR